MLARHEPPPRVPHRRGRVGRRDRRDAARPPPRARGELLLRRRPGSGVFGVLATGFSVLLGFIIFLAFTSYDQSRGGRGRGARARAAGRDRAVLPPRPRRGADGRARLLRPERRHRGVGSDGGGHPARRGQPVGCGAVRHAPRVRAEVGLRAVGLRQVARPDLHARGGAARPHPRAVGIIPSPLWLVLFFISGVIFVYMLFFADRGERAKTQALLMGSVAAVITTMLLLLGFLDSGSTTMSAAFAPWPWSARFALWTRRSRTSASRCSSRVTPRDGLAGAPAERRGSDRLELAAAFLLALATVATAWSGYQASRWNGEQAKAFSRANATRIESTRASALADAQNRDRRGDVHAVGERLRAGGDGAGRLLLRASARSSSPSSRRGSPRRRSRTLTLH